MAKSMFDDLFKKYIGSTAREPGYAYGDILPFRMKTDAQGRTIPGTVDWGLAYSNAAKGMFDTLMAPRQAMQGQEFTPEQAMSFAANVTAPGVATARYSPGMFNMPMVYHGTPHRFEATPENPLGEFRASKIGTGEGAQAYGHGIYVAEDPKVATNYRKKLSYRAIVNEFLDNLPEDADFDDVLELADSFSPVHGNLIKALQESGWLGFDYPSQAIHTVLYDSLEGFDITPELNKAIKEAKGFLYTADLPDEMVDRMLDWDKPLSEQPEAVKAAFVKAQAGEDPLLADLLMGMVPSAKGSAAYKTMAEQVGGKAKASELLQKYGIPGIKYLDAESRRGYNEKPTRNFVIFPGEEKKASIIKKEQQE